MPTTNAKARKLLRGKKAYVANYYPFTIQLKYDSTEYVQKCTLGVDLGYANIGFSVTTDLKELISGEIKLLKGQIIGKVSVPKNQKRQAKTPKTKV